KPGSRQPGPESGALPPPTAFGVKPHLAEILGECRPVAGPRGQSLAAQVPPDTVIQALGSGVLPAGGDGGRDAALDLLFGRVRVEEGAAVGGAVVDRALAVEVPVTGAAGTPRRDQGRERLVRDGPQVLLRPREHVLPRWAEALQVGRVEAPRHVPARGRAEGA